MFEDLYKTPVGRFTARCLASPFISHLAGAFMNSRLSKPMIGRFAAKNGIDLSEAAEREFGSFNAFFTRRLKDGQRSVCADADALASPCDGLLSVWDVREDSRFEIKGTRYSIDDLTQDPTLAGEFDGGKCLIFRLTPAHYHRYIWPCDGRIAVHKTIKGIYHTVRPTALENVQVFKTNTRQYVLAETGLFGKMLIMEVGALLVGRIVNHKTEGSFEKGEEKGYFEFGGSTIVVMTQKDRVKLPERFDTPDEIPIKAGERLNL